MFLGNIAREFRENADLRATFGFKRFVKDNETELIIQWTDGEQTRIAAHGAQQKIRGTNWRNIRPDLIVCDDLENDEAVLNDDRRDKFRKWFLKTLIPIGGKSADIRVVGTILHEDSLLARLMPDIFEDKQIIVTPLRTTTAKKRAWKSALYRAHPDFNDFSEILWPEAWNEERLKLVRQTYIDDHFPEGYAQEYLNNPMANEGAYFQEEDMIPILLEEMDSQTKSPETFYIGVDLAISTESRRAFSVWVVVGVDPQGTLRVREVVRKRVESLEIMDEFFHLHEKYKYKSAMREEPIFLVEKENIAKALGPVLYRDMEERNQYLSMEMMPPIKDKMLRARSFQARVRANRVEFDHEADWWPAYKHEMITFPRSTYKDQVDGSAWVGFHLADIQNAPTPQQIADDLYEEEYEDARREWGGGANRITGY
jgi:predicted phage terminase large subunit-like protein